MEEEKSKTCFAKTSFAVVPFAIYCNRAKKCVAEGETKCTATEKQIEVGNRRINNTAVPKNSHEKV